MCHFTKQAGYNPGGEKQQQHLKKCIHQSSSPSRSDEENNQRRSKSHMASANDMKISANKKSIALPPRYHVAKREYC